MLKSSLFVGGTCRLKKAGDAESACSVLRLLEDKMTLCLRFLSHADDDVSAAVLEMAREYVQLLKQKPAEPASTPAGQAERRRVEALLFVIFEKTKYDEDGYGGAAALAGEDEALFLDYRKQLRVLFDNVVAFLVCLAFGFGFDEARSRSPLPELLIAFDFIRTRNYLVLKSKCSLYIDFWYLDHFLLEKKMATIDWVLTMP